MATNRKKIPPKIAARVEFASDRTCCVCREPGKAYQIHHIDGDRNNHNLDNLVLLCLQHHHEAEVTGGLGRKLSSEQIRLYREQWNAIVAELLKGERRSAATAPPPDRTIEVRRLVREGVEILSEALMAGNARESTLDRGTSTEKQEEEKAFRDRERVWATAVEAALAGTPAAKEFMDTHGIPASGLYAIHNRTKARVDFLRRTVTEPSTVGATNPKEELTSIIDEGMRLRTAVVLRPDHPLPFSSDPLFQWARKAYAIVREHFVLHADEFYGEDPELGSSYFGLAFACAAEDMDRGAYLESRLRVLKEALRTAR